MKKENNLKDKSVSELQDELSASLKEQFNLRMQKGGNPQQVKSSAFKNVRKTIARIKTMLHQKKAAVLPSRRKSGSS